MGGSRNGHVLQSVERYDVAADAWTPLAGLPWDRRGCAAVAMMPEMMHNLVAGM